MPNPVDIFPLLSNIVIAILSLEFSQNPCLRCITLNRKVWQYFYTTINGNLHFFNLKSFKMGNLLYIIAVILIIIWAISFLGGFYTGGLIHILLVIAVIAIIFKLLNRGTPL
jgi:Family of unknown function (DUF5670)